MVKNISLPASPFILLIALFFYANNLSAQPTQKTVIEGVAKGAENRNIRLILTADYISDLPIKKAETRIDSQGVFRLETDIPETCLAQLAIDYYRTEIFLEPGKNYRLTFLPFDYHIDEKINPYTQNISLSYRLDKTDSNELNFLINRFQYMLDTFTSQHVDALINQKDRSLVERFVSDVNRHFDHSVPYYFNYYKQYKLAELEEVVNIKSRGQFFNELFYDQPVQYQNIAYMSFFNEFYRDYFPFQVKYPYPVFIKQINSGTNLPAILDSLGRDTTLQNEIFREMVLLKGLKEVYYNKMFKKKSIISLLDEMATSTKFIENKNIAENIRTKLLQETYPVIADFKWYDTAGKTYTRFSFKKKYLYLIIMKSGCDECFSELKLLQEAANNLSTQKIDFVVLNVDYRRSQYIQSARQLNLQIPYLHFGPDVEWTEDLNVRVTPVYLLIDANGLIISDHYIKPSENLIKALKSLE